MFFPALIIIVGLIWLLNSLGIVSTEVWQVILPVVVILWGVSMVSKKHSWCSWGMCHKGCCKCEKCGADCKDCNCETNK